ADLQWQDVIYEPKQQRHGDEENHRCAVHREKLIEGVGTNQMIVRHGQLQADDKGFDSTNDEKKEAGQHVKNTNALVVYSGKPGEFVLPALGGIQNDVPQLCRGTHPIHWSVERYFARSSSCSSVRLKSGMSAPGLMCCGLFSQRRMLAGVLAIMPE